jgi:uncharacterized protein (DUF362 family)
MVETRSSIKRLSEQRTQGGYVEQPARIAIVRNNSASYPEKAPFYPPRIYPEYPFRSDPVDIGNTAYPLVREMLHLLQMDRHNFGTPSWNPLRLFVKPGENVLIKPNLIIDSANPICTTTHGSIIRVLIDYVWIALKGRGKILIGDAPQSNANFDQIVNLTGLRTLQEYYESKGISVELVDLRSFISDRTFTWRKRRAHGPTYRTIDLGENSYFHDASIDFNRFYGAYWDRREVKTYHSSRRHRYTIPQAVLDADVILMVPKMKTHQKTGVTLSLKNAVGILNDKNCLPHYRIGWPPSGDKYQSPQCFLEKLSFLLSDRLADFLCVYFGTFGKIAYQRIRYPMFFLQRTNPNSVDSGGWYGNDTLWRGILDVNRAMLYSDKNGFLQSEPQRRCFSVIDGIVGGEKEGPMEATPKKCGVVLGGFNAAVLDAMCTTLMGFDFNFVPLISNGLRDSTLTKHSERIEIATNVPVWNEFPVLQRHSLRFKPSKGWRILERNYE